MDYNDGVQSLSQQGIQRRWPPVTPPTMAPTRSTAVDNNGQIERTYTPATMGWFDLQNASCGMGFSQDSHFLGSASSAGPSHDVSQFQKHNSNSGAATTAFNYSAQVHGPKVSCHSTGMVGTIGPSDGWWQTTHTNLLAFADAAAVASKTSFVSPFKYSHMEMPAIPNQLLLHQVSLNTSCCDLNLSMAMQNEVVETSSQNLLLAMEKSVGYGTTDVQKMFLNSSLTESYGNLSYPMTMHNGLAETLPLSSLSSIEELISFSTEDVLVHPSDEGKPENINIDLNMTPKEKPKRKKHRPKVIRESKPTKTPKPVTPKPVNPSGKRKYVRRKITQVSSGNLSNEQTETAIPSIRKRCMSESSHNPCNIAGAPAETELICQLAVKRRLNFELTRDECTESSLMFATNAQSHAEEACPVGKVDTAASAHHNGALGVVENLPSGIPFGVDFSIHQVQNSGFAKIGPPCSPPCINETVTTNILLENPTTPPQPSTKENMKKRAWKEFLKTTSNTDISQELDIIQLNSHETSIFLPNGKRSEHTLDHNALLNQFSTYGSSVHACIGVEKLNESHGASYNDPCLSHGGKKYKAEHENTFTSNIASSLTCMPSIDWKRHMETYDTAEAFSSQLLSAPQQPLLSNESRQSGNHIETLFVSAKSRMKVKRGRKKQISETSIHFAMHNQKDMKISEVAALISPDYREEASVTSSVEKLRGGALVQGGDVVNEIIQKFLHLSLIEQVEVDSTRVQNDIVPYTGNGNMVPYTGNGNMVPYESPLGLTKKRRPRPKVNLDPETNRVWNLLMGEEDADMTQGTETEKEKWWKEEREIFRGRVDSFIARMHLVQGDRGFSKWKGSVVDSVVGVFLTQNVSDHLSSSAFMALAARFPVNSRHRSSEFIEEKVSSIERDDSVIVAHDETSKKQGQILLGATSLDSETAIGNESFGSNSNDTVVDYSKVNCHDLMQNVISAAQDTIYSVPGNAVTLTTNRGLAVTEDKWPVEEAGSSHNFTISSQNSSEHPIQTADLIGMSSLSDFREDDLTIGSMCYGPQYSFTFTELLNGVLDDASCNIIDTDSITFTPMTSVQDANHVNNPSLSTSPPLPYYFYLPSSSGLEHFALTDERLRLPHSDSSEMRKANTFNEIISSNEDSISNISNVLRQNLAEIPGSLPAADLYLQACEHCIQPLACQEVESSITKQFSCPGNLLADLNEVPSFGCDFMKYSLPSDDCAVKFQQEKVVCETHSKQAVDFHIQKHKFDNLRDSPNSCNNSNPSEISDRLQLGLNDHESTLIKQSSETSERKSTGKKVKDVNEKNKTCDWDSLRIEVDNDRNKRERNQDMLDSVDWKAVRSASVKEISDTIRERGMNNLLAERIKEFLDRVVRDHGSIDLEWLRDIEPGKAKDYLLSIRGLGLKSVECVRLLTLHHLAFPVDTNVGRICVRLGWVPLQPLPESLQLHLLELYPILETIQKYLWPRLCKLSQKALYELHYQLITFGKVFCTKSKPNCNACPMRGECKHFASAFASARLALPGPEDKSLMRPTAFIASEKNYVPALGQSNVFLLDGTTNSQVSVALEPSEPFIEEPATPEAENIVEESAIEDAFYEDPDEIPTIKLNTEQFTQNLQNYMQSNNMELKDVDISNALVVINPEVASIPMPKLKNVSRLRTEHLVYELPDSHPLLEGLDPREEDDPSPYLLAIWTPGETAQSTEPPNASCSSQETGVFCNATECFACNSKLEARAQIVRGTILIPCRTAMRGSFPLNGTYFQVNEVFADHCTSRNPIDVPREWLWRLPRRTVYFGTSVTSIFKGLTTEDIQLCFWRGFVCVRGFDKETRAPKPLYARLHFPASKVPKSKQQENSSSGKRTANRMN